MASKLAKWLEDAGLGKYAEVFAEAAIEVDMLAELTDSDLQELGLSIGDRLRLRRHLKVSPVGRSDASVDPKPHSDPPATSEHRQITVLFCDLVGWTALSREFDSEDLSEILSECRVLWTTAIERYDGFVAHRLGDGMMAYFGHPHAYEDGAERAILSGLDIVKAIGELRDTFEAEIARRLAVRVGIATGKVLVNKRMSPGSEEVDVLGYTPNFAARLQNAASPDTVVVSTTTAALAWKRFQFEAKEDVKIKGIDDQLRIFQVIGRLRGSEAASRHIADNCHQIIGREHEVGLLKDRWKAANEGDGQIIVLSGEAGIGKSSIAHTLLQHANSADIEIIKLECRSYYSNSFLHPVVDFVHTHAQIGDNDNSAEKLEKLYNFLDLQGLPNPHDHALFADLLLIADDSQGHSAMSSERLKTETLKSIVSLFLQLADRKPKIILFEDSHWADPTSLELLEALAERIPTVKALMIVTTRGNEINPIGHQANVSCLRLSRLAASQCEQIIRNCSQDVTLPDNLVEQILSKSDGIPFFLEELTKSVCANISSDTHAAEKPASPDSYVNIPAKLYDTLLSRLDSTPEARKLVGYAAAIGREFSEDLLSKVSGLKPKDTRRMLSVLIKAGLLVHNPSRANEIYLFKHALVQDAIYEGLTRNIRRERHGRIAAVLEDSFPNIAKQSPEILAQHFDLAKDHANALRYWEQAGRLAMEHSATTEALSHLGRALSALEKEPTQQDYTQRKISLLTTYGAALTSVKGYTAPETVAAYEEAWELSDFGEDKTCFHEILYGMWNSAQVGSDYEHAQHLADTCLAFAEEQHCEVSRLVANNLCGVTSTLRGDHQRARKHLTRSVQSYDPSRFQSLALSTGEDPGVESLSYLALNKWFMGDPKAALEQADRSLSLANEIAYKQSVVYSLAMRGVLLHFCKEADELICVADEIIGQSNRHNYPFFVEWGRNLKGWALTRQGEHDEGPEMLSNKWQQGFSAMLHAKVYLEVRRRDSGLKVIDAVIRDQPWLAPEAQRVKGELLLLRPESDLNAARQCFLDAYAQAEEQGATSLMLKAAISMVLSETITGMTAPTEALLQKAISLVDPTHQSTDRMRATELLDLWAGSAANAAQ